MKCAMTRCYRWGLAVCFLACFILLILGTAKLTGFNTVYSYHRMNQQTSFINQHNGSLIVRENEFPHVQGMRTKTPGVPKILHQIWSNDVLPNEFVENVKGLVKLNPPPEWSYWFWTLPNGRMLIERKYPELLSLFDGVDDLMKSDILRVCIIHHYGGVYLDLDTVGVKPLKPFVENTNCSLVNEPPEHTIANKMIVRVDSIINAALFCRPSHPFFDELIRLLENQKPTCKLPVQCVGPYVLSHAYYEMKRENNYSLLPRLENYQLFQDVYSKAATKTAASQCSGTNYLNAEIWRREACDEWIRRGKENRKLSELAYTYHTWYHVGARKVTSDPKNKITSLVPHAFLFDKDLLTK